MKRRRFSKYDLIIYSCLFGAAICIVIGSNYYLSELGEKTTFKEEVKSALEEIKGEEPKEDKKKPATSSNKPDKLKDLDEVSVVQKYLDLILDQVQIDELISYKMIRTWDIYEVMGVYYQKEITENYYHFITDIKITGKYAELPTNKNLSLSTDEYSVITLNIYLAYSPERHGYIVKNIDI